MTNYGIIRGRILDAADMNQSGFADITTSGNPFRLAVNASITGLYDLLLSLGFGSEQMAIKVGTIALSTSTDIFDLPSDCYKPVKMTFIDTDGTWYDLPRFSMDRLSDMHVNGASISSSRDLKWIPWASWVTSGSVLRIKFSARFSMNPPSTVGTMTVFYAPFLTTIGTSDLDSIPLLIPPSWEDWIVYDCAAYLLGREESDPSYCESRRARAENLITRAAKDRVMDQPSSMEDTSRRWG